MNKLGMFLLKTQYKIRNLMTKEDGAVDIVAIVVVIGIAVILALAFKDEIVKILKDIFKGIEENVGDINNKTDLSGADGGF